MCNFNILIFVKFLKYCIWYWDDFKSWREFLYCYNLIYFVEEIFYFLRVCGLYEIIVYLSICLGEFDD